MSIFAKWSNDILTKAGWRIVPIEPIQRFDRSMTNLVTVPGYVAYKKGRFEFRSASNAGLSIDCAATRKLDMLKRAGLLSLPYQLQ